MADRIRFDETGMKISPVGVNVNTATTDQLIFDSSGTQLRLILRGQVLHYASDNRQGGTRDVMYPGSVSFTSSPLGFIGFRLSQGSSVGTTVPVTVNFSSGVFIYVGEFFNSWVKLSFLTDRVRLQWLYNSDGDPVNSTFYYALAEYA